MLLQRHRRDEEKCDLCTEMQRHLIWLKQEEVNGSDRPIYITPLTSEARGEPHSLVSGGLPLRQPPPRVLHGDGDRTYRRQSNLLVIF